MKSGARILVVDDEPAIRKLLQRILEKEGFQVIAASTGAEGVTQLTQARPDIIILDLELPDMTGLEVLKKVREISMIPILILTVHDTQDEKVTLLEAGADDYITKPFGIPEFLARLKVAFRHGYATQAEEATFKCGALEIHFPTRSVTIAGIPVKLTATEYDVLKLLAKYPGRIVTQQQLLREIWHENSTEYSHYLRIYIAQLRKKLETSEILKGMIITEPGIGYRLSQ